MDPTADPKIARWGVTLAFVASAAVVAGALRISWSRPIAVALLLTGSAAYLLGRWLAKRRMRRILLSGDVRSLLHRWSPALSRVPHPATMGPLMMATAFAAYGWVEQARAALAAAERGPAWEAALEHRLFLDALLLTFEGDRDGALEQAERLSHLPLPSARGALQDRVRMLRVAMGALARAFAHQSRQGDQDLLREASETSPLVFWAMRYAAAVVAVDRRSFAEARALLAEAPVWPAESTFRAFHDEILAQIPS